MPPSPLQSPTIGSSVAGTKLTGFSVFLAAVGSAASNGITSDRIVAMTISIFIDGSLRQRLVLRFRQERQHDDPDEQYQAHPHPGSSEAFDIAAQTSRDPPERERCAGGGETAEVVAEARAGA